VSAVLKTAGLSLRKPDILGDRIDDVISALNILLPEAAAHELNTALTRDPVWD
jgi:hypothetical protein